MSKPVPCVLDASAVLTYLKQESGSGLVDRWIPHAAISSVNLSEVARVLIRDGVAPPKSQQILENLFLEVIDFSIALAHATAALAPLTESLGLSLGDRACLATAQSLRRPVLTADSAWTALKIPGIVIHLIR